VRCSIGVQSFLIRYTRCSWTLEGSPQAVLLRPIRSSGKAGIVMAIKGFSGQYRFLSNFYPSMIYKYPTVEHFYQAMKTHDQELRSRIAACTTPGEAKRMGRNLDLRKDWEDIKNDVMLGKLLMLLREELQSGVVGDWWTK
jgi:hypothetical protein